MSTTTSSEASRSFTASPAPTTAAEWGERTHYAELPSGAAIRFRFPSLAEMIALGSLPEDLLEIAVAEWKSPGSAAELAAAPFDELGEDASDEDRETAAAASRAVAERIAALNREVIARALIEPAMSPDQLRTVPYTDLEYLTRIVNRVEPFDAAGRRIGPEPISTFRGFAEEHECAADCQACEAARRRLSSVQ